MSLRQGMSEWCTCFSEGLGPAAAEVTQLPIELPQGLSPLRLGFCMDQICQPLHLRQAQLPVGERPPGELACFRWPQPWHTACGKVQDPEAPGPYPGHRRSNTSNPRLHLPRACRTPLTTAGPPCTWNSAQSSPVKLWGPSMLKRWVSAGYSLGERLEGGSTVLGAT